LSLVSDQAVFLSQAALLIRHAPEVGLAVTAGELYRTPEQQRLYYESGRSRTMNSQHMKRLALDLNFFQLKTDGTLRLVSDSAAVRHLGAFWESLDPKNSWGGNWKSFPDLPHFERR
jgi:hypothetical protein